MKMQPVNRTRSIFSVTLWALGLAAIWAGLLTTLSRGCTIFVLTDSERTLFCNNEDWSDPKTRIWFVPGNDQHYGGVYVGFDNNFAQGGMNTRGLAFDWVAGYSENWKPDPDISVVWGNSGQQALENCASVQEAIAFFQKHQDRGFYRAKILLADKSGASVIIGGKEGKLEVKPANQCRGFGYGAETLNKMLTKTTEPTASKGFEILRRARQKGEYATKYSNIFDLKSGEIFLWPLPGENDQVILNLGAELAKGGHYYDMPKIRAEMKEPMRPLLASMERLQLDRYKPIHDREPEVAARAKAMLRDAVIGKPRAEDYTPELWAKILVEKSDTEAVLKSFGPLLSLTLVDRSDGDARRTYRYRMEFQRNTLLQCLVFDQQNRLVAGTTEDIR
jgi:hypothetical protein